MRRIPRLAGLAALAAAGLAAIAPGAAYASPASAHGSRAVTPASIALKTKKPNVHVRSVPHTGTGSKLVAIIPAAGTTVQVECYTVTAGRYWFKITAPAGYVAARNIDFPRPHGIKVPAGLPACA